MTIQNFSYVYIYLKYIKCSVSEVLKRIYCQTNNETYTNVLTHSINQADMKSLLQLDPGLKCFVL